MNTIRKVMAGIVVIAGGAFAQSDAPKTDLEKISYSLGVDIGKNFRMQDMQLEVDMMAKGIRDGLAGGECAMTDEDMQKTVAAFQEIMMQKLKMRAMEQSSDNRKAGQNFLAENKKKEGVVETASGLQYVVMTEGSGPKPSAATDQVTVHYRGTVLSGKEFDSSFKRNEPASFRLNQVIRGWTEGLQLMSVGSKYKFFIPSDLAYGDQQKGPDIAPGSTLIFEIELLDTKK